MAKNSRHIKWLYSELPELVSGNVLTPEAAEKIKEKYGPQPEFKAANFLRVLLGAGGALLIGIGVITLFAHNWDALPRYCKLFIAFAPMLASLCFCFWVLKNKRGSAPFSEGAAVFNALSCAACLAIISQVYHAGGSLRDYLTACLLLSFLLIYLFDSFAMLMLYIGAMVVWTGGGPFGHVKIAPFIVFLILAALAAPRAVKIMTKEPDSAKAQTLAWELLAAALLIIPFWTERSGFYALAFFFSALSACSLLSPASETKVWIILRRASVFLTLFILCLMSFKWHWSGYYTLFSPNLEPPFIVTCAALLGYLAAAGYGARKKRGALAGPPQLAGAAVILAALLCGWTKDYAAPSLVINLFIACAAVFYIWRGWKSASLAIINLGAALGAALIFMRFFDSNVSLVAKGVAFIVCGAAVIWFNFRFMSRAKGGVR